MTTDSTKPPMDCQEARDDLPALLYQDLEEDRKQQVERHLADCSACREQLEGHRKTMRLLDTWSIDAEAPTSAERQPRPRRKLAWLRPTLVGSAAALLMFASISALGGELQYENGRLTVSIGGSEDSYSADSPDLSRFAERLTTEVQGEVDVQIEALVTLLDASFTELTRREEQRRVMLVRALDQQRYEDLRRQNEVLEVLLRRQEVDALTTRQGFDEIAMIISTQGPATDTDERF